MGYRDAMPTLDETSPVLLGTLLMLMDNYGVRGVYDTCAQLVNELTPPDAGNGEGGIDLNRQYSDAELRNSPYAGAFADVVAASQDPVPVPMKAMVQITGDGDYNEPHAYPENQAAAQARYDGPGASLGLAITDAPEDFDAWRQQRGEAAGDPQNVGPMGNR